MPFSFHDPESLSMLGVAASIVTGTIDCLARSRDGRVTVLEFMTDVPRPTTVGSWNRMWQRPA